MQFLYIKKKWSFNFYHFEVGAGSAGAVIANRLSEDEDVSVLLLEAGESEFGNDDIRIPQKSGATQKASVDWNYHTLPQKNSHLAMNDRVIIVLK